MKKVQATLEDLHYDVLKEIVIRVAGSSDGAKDFAKTISVSRNFRQFVDDGAVLRSVCFDDLTISGGWESFQQIGGIISRSAQAGHAQAQFILGKIILVSASQLFIAKEFGNEKAAPSSASQDSDGSLPKGNTQVSSFLENFSTPDSISFHFNFVKHFMSQATAFDIHEMWLHLQNYMEYFIKCKGFDWQPIMHWYSWLHNAKEALENLVGIMAFRIRHMHSFVSEKTEIRKLKAEQVGTTEEEFALLFKGLMDMEAGLEEVCQAHDQDSVKKDAERANPAFLPFPWSFSGEAMTLERAVTKFRSAQGFVQEDIDGLLSELESRLFCQETTKHRHDKISYNIWLPFLSAYSLYWNQVWRHAP